MYKRFYEDNGTVPTWWDSDELRDALTYIDKKIAELEQVPEQNETLNILTAWYSVVFDLYMTSV